MNKIISILTASILFSAIIFVGCSFINEEMQPDEKQNTATTTIATVSSPETNAVSETIQAKAPQKTSTAITNVDEETRLISSKLDYISQPLFLALFSSNNKNMNLATTSFSIGVNIFDDESIRQIFIGEVLKSDRAYDSKWVIGELEDPDFPRIYDPEYIEYDIFNEVYKSYFGKDFDISKATVLGSKTNLDEVGYVYYDNRRDGLNGIGNRLKVDSISSDETTKLYTAKLTVEYTDINFMYEAFNPFGKSELKYKKDSNGNIILASYVITG